MAPGHGPSEGVRDLEEHDWRVRTCVGCQRTKQHAERTHQAALGRARRAPTSSSSSSAAHRPRAASGPRPRTPRAPRAPALRSVVLRPAPRPATPRAPAWRPAGWRPATPHAAAGVSRLSSLRPVTPRPKFSSRPRAAQPPRAARSAHPALRLHARPSTRPSSDDFPTDPRLRSPWYKRRLSLHLLRFLISEEIRTVRAMKRARAAARTSIPAPGTQVRGRPGQSPRRDRAAAAAAANGHPQEAQVRDPRRRNDRDLRLRAMERARADRLGASDPRRPRARGVADASSPSAPAAASPPRPFRRPFSDELVRSAAASPAAGVGLGAAAAGERTPPRTVPIAAEELHDSAPTAVINGVVWRSSKLGYDVVEPGIGVCYRFWRTWLRAAQEEGASIRAQSFRVREFNLAEARLARQEVTNARRLLRLPPRHLPLAPPPSPRRPPTAPPRLLAPADARCCDCCRCCACRNCCACEAVEECCDSCESCRQVIDEHSRARRTPSPPPPPPPPLPAAGEAPAQPPPPPLACCKATPPPPPPPSPLKASVPIMPLLLLSMMVPKEDSSPDPSISPPAVSPFPLSVWPTLLHSPPLPVPHPSPVSMPVSISASLHSQGSMYLNQKVPVCSTEVATHGDFPRRAPPPIEVVSGEDSSSSSVMIISPPPPPPPPSPGVSRPAVTQSNQQLRALQLAPLWPTSPELPLIPLPSGEPGILKTVKSIPLPQSQRAFTSMDCIPENVADIPLPDAPPPPCNGLSLPLPPTTQQSAPESSLNNPVEIYQSIESEHLTSSNRVVDMDLDDSAEE